MNNPAPVLMVQGTGSHVGKSLLTAALCRIFTQQGVRVAPFKAQNMANNSFVCADGGEIGRAQAEQAAACKIPPTVDMNPILMKPASDHQAQIILMGHAVAGTMDVAAYREFKKVAWPTVCGALDRLRAQHDLVIAEGAGSPAEINLRGEDIVNMRTAHYADAAVLLVGDIDKGGVFAQFVGTLELLEPEERRRIKGFIVNKFRGEKKLLDPGLEFLEQRTGIPVLGVVPFLREHGIAEEDALPHEHGILKSAKENASILVDVIRFPHISNFTDFDPLERDPRVRVRYLSRPPQEKLFSDLLILPGTKSTIADLRFLRESGLADYVKAAATAGRWVIGICGGYQMLGKKILDPHHAESAQESADGLGLLPHTTLFRKTKTTTQIKGLHAESGARIEGYEIHMGKTDGDSDLAPLFQITEKGGKPVAATDGTRRGNLFGTYVHGLFDSPKFLEWVLSEIASSASGLLAMTPVIASEQSERSKLDLFDQLAAAVRQSLNMELLNSFTKPALR